MKRTVTLAVATGLACWTALALAAAPAATTGPANAVGATSATVNGSVNPGGETTTWFVEYGATTGYGARTAVRSAGNGTSPVDVTAQISGLATGSTTHYRLVAQNQHGTTRGTDATFATRSAPGVTTSNAAAIGPTRALLGGTVDPNGLPTRWYLDYGTSTRYGSRTPSQDAGSGGSPLAVSVDVGGLQAGVAYHFRVVAANDAGTARGGDRSFRTDAGPSVATGGAAAIGPISARIGGSVDPNGRSSTAWFEYGTTDRYGTRTPERPVGFVDRAVEFAETLGNLQPGTTIHYRIVGRSDAATSYGRDRFFQTSAAPTVATGAPSAVAATTATATGSVNPNGRATSWWFELGTTVQYGSRTPLAPAGDGRSPVPVSAPLAALAVAAEIHVRLVAESSGGRTYGNDVVFRTSGPPTVTTGIVTRLGISRATLSGSVGSVGLPTTWWLELGRTQALGRRVGGGSAGSGTSTVGVLQSLGGLTPGVRYFFRVVAESQAGRTTGATASFATAPVPRTADGRPVRCTIVGTVSPDRLRGTPRRDVICGLGGNDRITGLGGDDVIIGGAGWDRIEGGAGADRIEGGTGRDLGFGGSGADHLQGGPGDDELLGGGGRDRLLGDAGNDALGARDGRGDVLDGGVGRDSAAFDLVDRRSSIERRLLR